MNKKYDNHKKAEPEQKKAGGLSVVVVMVDVEWYTIYTHIISI